MKKHPKNQNNVNKELEKTIIKIEKFEWKHHNLILLIFSLVIAYYIFKSEYFYIFVSRLGDLGYIGSFIAGVFFAHGLTTVPAAVALYVMAKILNPFFIALIAASGTVLSDYLIFRFVRDKLTDEIRLLTEEIGQLTQPISSLVFHKKIKFIIWKKMAHSRIWKTIIPVIAGFIIASPLPDELGVALFGAVKFELKKFIVCAYCLHFIGILTITYLSKVL